MGLRFTNVELPVGARVTEAYIQFVADETHDRATSLELAAELAGNSAAFAKTNYNLSQRPRTTQRVHWRNLAAWQTGQRGSAQRTPDLSPLLNELITAPGWARGNALTILVSGSGQRVGVSYEGRVGDAAVLVISYSSSLDPSGGQAARSGSFSNKFDWAELDHMLSAKRATWQPTEADIQAARAVIEALQQAEGRLLAPRQGGQVGAAARQPEVPVIYPNPVSTVLHLVLPEGVGLRSATLVDATGRPMALKYQTGEPIDVEDLPAGVYTLLLEQQSGRMTRHRVVKD